MYYYTDHEELEALRKQTQSLLKENNTLKDALDDTIKEAGKANSSIREIKRVVYDHLKFNDKGEADYITAKPVLDVIEASAKRLEKMLNGGKNGQ